MLVLIIRRDIWSLHVIRRNIETWIESHSHYRDIVNYRAWVCWRGKHSWSC